MTTLRLREERDALEARALDHLNLIDGLRARVERQEAEDKRLHTELDELRGPMTEVETKADADRPSLRQPCGSGIESPATVPSREQLVGTTTRVHLKEGWLLRGQTDKVQ